MAQDEARLVAGRYRLVEPVGRGGMGLVWRAEDVLLHRAVAVKEIHLRFGLPEQAEHAAARTLREARAAAGLRHPGIVAVHDVVVDNGRPLIVMELVDGRSLADAVRADGPFDEERTAAIARQMLDALRVAHAAGILHRDVKPANILLDGDRAILTDFGIAAVSDGTALTETNALVGSPDYLAPERVNGREASAASDLWSVGVTLCVMLRGESPFQREDTQSTLAAVLTHDPPPGAERLWPLIEGLLHKDPARRLTAAAAIDHLDGVPTPAPRRWPRLVALLAVVALVAGAAVFWSVQRSGETAAEDPPTSTAPPAPEGFVWHDDPAGFSLLVPRGWFREVAGQEVTWSSYTGQRIALLAHVYWQDGAGGTAPGTLAELERSQFSGPPVSEYRRIRLTEGPASSELECTYRVALAPPVYSHDRVRMLTSDSARRYMVSVAVDSPDSAAARDAAWTANEERLSVVIDSFRLTT